jgi:general secretion pathway protein J
MPGSPRIPATAARGPAAGSRGFTLVEVLVALAITAFVATIAYTSLSTALAGIESTRDVSERSYEVNRALMVLNRDLRQLVDRPVRDEFGELEPALLGGELARFPLAFTRAGWHNPGGLPRSQLQRVAYRVEDETLWRDSWPVLDRAGDTEPQSVRLLDGVEFMQLAFLPSLERLNLGPDDEALDTETWDDNWVRLPGASGDLGLPMALELRLELTDWGELRRLYALPPL